MITFLVVAFNISVYYENIDISLIAFIIIGFVILTFDAVVLMWEMLYFLMP